MRLRSVHMYRMVPQSRPHHRQHPFHRKPATVTARGVAFCACASDVIGEDSDEKVGADRVYRQQAVHATQVVADQMHVASHELDVIRNPLGEVPYHGAQETQRGSVPRGVSVEVRFQARGKVHGVLVVAQAQGAVGNDSSRIIPKQCCYW